MIVLCYLELNIVELSIYYFLGFADYSKNANAVGVKEDSVAIEQLDAWSAHRTETGTIYYYNAVTGQSTYQQPAGFKGEVRFLVSTVFCS